MMSDDNDMTMAVLTRLGAAFAFCVGIYQWRKGQDWQRAAKGRDLIDDLLKSDDSDDEYYAWDAMKMLDYLDAKQPLQTKPLTLNNPEGEKTRFPVDQAVLERALKSDRTNEADPKLLYVRECFDEFYFKLGQLQDAIDNKLVKLKHVSCPMDYYAGLMAKDVMLHYTYMQKFQYDRALRFLQNFPCWLRAMVKNGLYLIAK